MQFALDLTGVVVTPMNMLWKVNVLPADFLPETITEWLLSRAKWITKSRTAQQLLFNENISKSHNQSNKDSSVFFVTQCSQEYYRIVNNIQKYLSVLYKNETLIHILKPGCRFVAKTLSTIGNIVSPSTYISRPVLTLFLPLW